MSAWGPARGLPGLRPIPGLWPRRSPCTRATAERSHRQGPRLREASATGAGSPRSAFLKNNIAGQTLGPFLSAVPTPPFGWTAYTAGYVANANGTFGITTGGDRVVVTAP